MPCAPHSTRRSRLHGRARRLAPCLTRSFPRGASSASAAPPFSRCGLIALAQSVSQASSSCRAFAARPVASHGGWPAPCGLMADCDAGRRICCLMNLTMRASGSTIESSHIPRSAACAGRGVLLRDSTRRGLPASGCEFAGMHRFRLVGYPFTSGNTGASAHHDIGWHLRGGCLRRKHHTAPCAIPGADWVHRGIRTARGRD